MLRSILVSAIIIGALIAAPKSTAPIDIENIGVVKVEKLGTDAVPQKMNLQGYLTYTNGNPVDSTLQMTFRIYRGGSEVWQEVNQTVRCSLGLFSFTLGNANPNLGSVFAPGDPCQLKLWIGNDSFPRIEITSVGFAFRSVKSDTASYAALISRPITPPITRADVAANFKAPYSDTADYVRVVPPIDSARVSGNAWKWANHTWGDLYPDADKLDGQHGSYYAPTTHNHNHNDLQNIQGGTPTERFHLTSSQHTDLTDGGDCGIHNHDTRYYTKSETDGRFVNDNAGEVGNEDLENGAVTTSKISENNVTLSKIERGPSGAAIIGQGSGANAIWGNPTPGSGSPYYIQNQNSSAQSASFYISGSGKIEYNSSNPALTITNSGTGNGLYVTNASQGVVIGSTSYSGIYINNAGEHGIEVNNASQIGVRARGTTGGSFTGTTGAGVSGGANVVGIAGSAYNVSGNRNAGYFQCANGPEVSVAAQIGGTNYKIYGSGNVACNMPTREGRKVLFAPECPEPYFEDFGQGRLTNGYCHIELDPLFLDCIKTDEQHPMKVFIQLNDDCNGVYVKVGTTGFDVYELQNGNSNVSFTYRVVANRRDTDYLRFPNAIEPPKVMEPPEIGGSK